MNIQTIVYLGLESTGLRESGRPRISEISLLAVNTNDFRELQIIIHDYISKKEDCNKIFGQCTAPHTHRSLSQQWIF